MDIWMFEIDNKFLKIQIGFKNKKNGYYKYFSVDDDI